MDAKQIDDDVCDRKEKSSTNVDGKKNANLWVRHRDTKAQHNWMMTQVQPEHVPLIQGSQGHQQETTTRKVTTCEE